MNVYKFIGLFSVSESFFLLFVCLSVCLFVCLFVGVLLSVIRRQITKTNYKHLVKTSVTFYRIDGV